MNLRMILVAAVVVAAVSAPRAKPRAKPPAAVAPSTTEMGMSASAGLPRDRFGVRMIYPSMPAGREWFAKWDNRRRRAIVGVDPDDPELDCGHGDGTYRVDGRGICTVGGRAPRLYVVDPARVRMWQNVEVTIYGMRIAETKAVSYAGLQAYARTDHTRDDDLCADRGYGGRLLYDGRADFEKEIAHHLPNGYVQADTTQAWQKKMPHRRWIGLKFVVRNVPGGVRLELWRDRRNGRDGGVWQKLGEWTDRGAWGAGVPPCAPGVDPAEVLRGPAPTVYIRNDEVKEIRYKWFSIREIDPGQ
ncbi:MAG: hypothetical protein AAB152_12920 [Candidatus Coatesbacteria bacterium]